MKKFISKLAGAAMAGLLFAAPYAHCITPEEAEIITKINRLEARCSLRSRIAGRSGRPNMMNGWRSEMIKLIDQLPKEIQINVILNILYKRALHHPNEMKYSADNIMEAMNAGIDIEHSNIEGINTYGSSIIELTLFISSTKTIMYLYF